jgi:hypothetical protein
MTDFNNLLTFMLSFSQSKHIVLVIHSGKHCRDFPFFFKYVLHYVIKFISDFRQIGGFLWVLRFLPSTNETDCHDITDILLKVALNTITLSLYLLETLYSFVLIKTKQLSVM